MTVPAISPRTSDKENPMTVPAISPRTSGVVYSALGRSGKLHLGDSRAHAYCGKAMPMDPQPLASMNVDNRPNRSGTRTRYCGPCLQYAIRYRGVSIAHA